MIKRENVSPTPESESGNASLFSYLWRVIGSGNPETHSHQPTFSLKLFDKEYRKPPRGTKRVMNHVDARLNDKERFYEHDLVKRNTEEIVDAICDFVNDLTQEEPQLEGMYFAHTYDHGAHRRYRGEVMPPKTAVKAISAALELLQSKGLPLLNTQFDQRQYHFETTQENEKEKIARLELISATKETPSIALKIKSYFDYFGYQDFKIWLEIGDTLNDSFKTRKEREIDEALAHKCELYRQILAEESLDELVFREINSDRVSLFADKLEKGVGRLHLKYLVDVKYRLSKGIKGHYDDEEVGQTFISNSMILRFIDKLIAIAPNLTVADSEQQKKAPDSLARLVDQDQRYVLTFWNGQADAEVVLDFAPAFIKEKQAEARAWFETQFPQMLTTLKEEKENRPIKVRQELKQLMTDMIIAQEWNGEKTDLYLEWSRQYLKLKMDDLLAESL